MRQLAEITTKTIDLLADKFSNVGVLLKTYFIFILILMVGFSGYMFLGRPGEIDLDFSKATNISSLTSLLGGEATPTIIQDKTPPYLNFVSGDVLVNAGAVSYKAEPFQRLRIGDEIFTLVNSIAILTLGKDQHAIIEPGSKVKIQGLPKRNRGFTDLSISKGVLLVDFFEGKTPVGIKVELPGSYVLTPNASFRVSISPSGNKIAVDREAIIVKRKNSSEEIAVEPGKGALTQEVPMKVEAFSWVDGFNWDQAYNRLSQSGIGTPSKVKAPLLRERTPEISRTALRPKRERPARAPTSLGKTSKPAELDKSPSKSKGFSKKALNVLSKVPVLGKNITESTDAVQNFEQVQADRNKALDNLEE